MNLNEATGAHESNTCQGAQLSDSVELGNLQLCNEWPLGTFGHVCEMGLSIFDEFPGTVQIYWTVFS